MSGKKTKGMMAEFRKFALRGNVIDLAVGVIIGGAFGTITASLVADIIMPVVGIFLGGIDFSSWSLELRPLYVGAEPTYLNIGVFIQTVINFIILAFVVFLIVKGINKIRERAEKKEETPAAPPEPSAEEKLLAEIRDLLKQK